MHPVEFTWYKAIVLIVSALALGVGILNIVYFNRIRLNTTTCTNLTSSEAHTALILNIVLVILAGVLFFWSLFRLIFSGEEKKDIVHKTYNTFHHSPDPRTYTSPETYASVATPPTTSSSVVTTYPASPIQIPSGMNSPKYVTTGPYTATTTSYPLPDNYTGPI
jgi:hypothetical protein